uniref:Uncharacterized protein n=1 Tax=Myoviridae sp. ct9Ns12 TaxID=2826626 RepID=A0A8S5MI79_9CAUD|nr:MAG TPA: hypothetical protein [Myoviridae sp. ct9Ns12]
MTAYPGTRACEGLPFLLDIHTYSSSPIRVTPMALYTGTGEKTENMVALNVLE